MSKFAPKQIEIKTKLKPTQQQVTNKDIIAEGKNLKVIAGAGSGKSSSLRYNAECLPHLNFLILCFNKANTEESNAHPDRPANIFYSTTHSLAYKEIICYAMRKKLSYLDFNDLKEFNLDKFLPNTINTQSEFKATSIKLHRAFFDCITYYCRSSKDDIGKFTFGYLSNEFSFNDDKPNLTASLEFGIETIDELCSLVEDYWNNLKDKNHPAKINHDVYLKLYQLGGFAINEFHDKESGRYINVDIIGLDEAQDSIPVVESIFANQTKQRLLIGDPMQQLYAWRGAGDAMNNFKDFTVGYLTESFRFNSTIAAIANKVLRNAGSDMIVTGSGKETEIKTQAYLCRTNASVLDYMFGYLGTNTKIYTSIDFKDIFSKLFHIQSCYFNEKPKYPNKELASIVDRVSLEQAIEFSDDLARLLKLREKLTSRGTLFSVKASLESLLLKDMKEADLVISTIHSSKGMEWSEVTIDDDFLIPLDNETIEDMLERLWETPALTCLLYVGITRSKVRINLPEYLDSLLEVETEHVYGVVESLDYPVQLEKYVVYYLYSKQGDLLYIGVTKDLENRLNRHYAVDSWMKNVCASATELEGFMSRSEAYAQRKCALQAEQPIYSDIYKVKEI